MVQNYCKITVKLSKYHKITGNEGQGSQEPNIFILPWRGWKKEEVGRRRKEECVEEEVGRSRKKECVEEEVGEGEGRRGRSSGGKKRARSRRAQCLKFNWNMPTIWPLIGEIDRPPPPPA
jgi:hypothetical protein